MTSESTKEKIILVVEDERPLAEAIQAKLEKNGFAVTTARTGQQALNYLEDLERVDVIWLDHYLLGVGNGLDFVVQIKNNPKWQSIPIFVVSNTASSSNIRSYIQLGVSSYYTKADYNINQIINDIEYLLGQTHSV
jgi:CheY-like chemotaxis protein